MSDATIDEPTAHQTGDTFNVLEVDSTPGPTFMPAYGSYVNVADIVKIDVSNNGVVHTVMAWLRTDVGASGKANAFAALTPGFDDEEDAQRAANEIVASLADSGAISIVEVAGRRKARWPVGL